MCTYIPTEFLRCFFSVEQLSFSFFTLCQFPYPVSPRRDSLHSLSILLTRNSCSWKKIDYLYRWNHSATLCCCPLKDGRGPIPYITFTIDTLLMHKNKETERLEIIIHPSTLIHTQRPISHSSLLLLLLHPFISNKRNLVIKTSTWTNHVCK